MAIFAPLNVRKNVMNELSVRVNTWFYIKVNLSNNTVSSGSDPKEGYIGLYEENSGCCFLVRFKFTQSDYDFITDTTAMSDDDIKSIWDGLLLGTYTPTTSVNFNNNRFYIKSINSIDLSLLTDLESSSNVEETDVSQYINDDPVAIVLDVDIDEPLDPQTFNVIASGFSNIVTDSNNNNYTILSGASGSSDEIIVIGKDGLTHTITHN